MGDHSCVKGVVTLFYQKCLVSKTYIVSAFSYNTHHRQIFNMDYLTEFCENLLKRVFFFRCQQKIQNTSEFSGFTGTFFSNSEWGSTQNVLMIVLHWSKQISRNCTHLLPNTRSTHTVKFFFSLMTVYRFGVDSQ